MFFSPEIMIDFRNQPLKIVPITNKIAHHPNTSIGKRYFKEKELA
jgi:hypothetical protein